MRPVYFTVTGTEVSLPCPMDRYISPTNISLAVLISGTENCTVQYTFDDVYAANYNPATGNWRNHPSLTSLTATADSNIAYPVSAIRIISNSGTGSAKLTILQSGGGGIS